MLNNHVISWCSHILFFLAVIFFLSANHRVCAQDDQYKTTVITLEKKNVTLQSILDHIAAQANVRFFYNHDQMDFKQYMSVNYVHKTLREVLESLFVNLPIVCEYQPNRVIVLKPRTVSQDKPRFLRITGQVSGAKDKVPLPGATVVLLERREQGCVTDENGKFAMTVPEGITGVVVSFIGYESETVHFNEKNTDLIIKLQPAAYEMEDVVVTGMAKRKVESFTGGYVSVKGEELKKLSPNNLLKALQLFDPSFRIIENNDRGSDPNAVPDFRLRGDAQLGSVDTKEMNMFLDDYSSRPNMPLFVLDGFQVPVQRIIDLDPERVESITILKDASATAIYGSKAANGVVVVETKAPMPGALNVSYSTNLALRVPDLSDYDLLNAQEKLDLEVAAGFFDPKNTIQMNEYNHYKSEVLKGVNTYWLSQPLRTAFSHRHTLSLEGGDEALRYRFAVNYGITPGVMKESDHSNLGLDLNLQYRRKKWNVGNTLTLTNSSGNNTPYGSFKEYTRLNPYYRPEDENGNILQTLDLKRTELGSYERITNPLYNTQFTNKDFSKNFSVVDNLMVECAILDNLRVSANVSLTKSSAKSENYKSRNHTEFAGIQDLTQRGSYKKSLGENFNWSADMSVNYNLSLNDHFLSIFGRWNIDEMTMNNVNLSAVGFPNDKMDDFLFGYKMDERVAGNESTTRSIGLIGQLSYMYKFRYALDASIRCDLSSRFGADRKMAPFWSVGARWNMYREKWLENTIVSNMVVRGSYGITGSQNYSPYQAIETYSFSELMFPYLSSDGIGAQLMGLGNDGLGWSKTKSTSVAVEFGLWQNRLNLELSYYGSSTDELLVDYTIAPSVGFTSMTENAGSLENKGVDVTLNLIPWQNTQKQVQWIVALTGSHNRNKIKKISNKLKAQNAENMDDRDAPLPIYQEGESTTRLFMVRSLGIDPATGEEVFLKRNGEKTFQWSAVDKVAVGDKEPKLRGGITSGFNYKNLSLSLGFTYSLGADEYNNTLVDKIENASLAYNVDRRAMTERWREPGQVAKYKGLSKVGHKTPASTRFLMKKNEFVFNSVNVGYRFTPEEFSFLKKCRIASASLGVTLEDIGRLSTIKQERGLDYPFERAFNLSLSVLFN